MKNRLYHCMYKTPDGDALKATYEGTFGGLTGKFLFAATHLTKSLVFAFSYHEGEVCMNTAIYGSDNELVVLSASKNPLEKVRHITVVSFDDDGFIPLPEGSRQCVLPTDLPFDKTQLVLETTSYQDLMRHGLQIFIYDDVANPIPAVNEYFRSIHPRTETAFNILMKAGLLKWVNLDEGINICPKLYHDIMQDDGLLAPTLFAVK